MRATPRLLLSLAALLIASASAATARADGALPAAATPVQREQAQSRFLRGKDLMNKRDHDGALSEFRASHEIVASPNTRLEIARCLETMGKLVEAYAEFGRTAVEAKELKAEDNRYQRAYDAAITERAQLQPMLGFVSLTVENPAEGTRVTVGGEELRRAAWGEPAPVMAGTTAVVVRTAGHAPVERTVTLAAGASAALTIDAQSGEPDSAAAPATAEAPVVQGPTGRSPLRTMGLRRRGRRRRRPGDLRHLRRHGSLDIRRLAEELRRCAVPCEQGRRSLLRKRTADDRESRPCRRTPRGRRRGDAVRSFHQEGRSGERLRARRGARVDRRSRVTVTVAPLLAALAAASLALGIAACTLDFNRFEPVDASTGSSGPDASGGTDSQLVETSAGDVSSPLADAEASESAPDAGPVPDDAAPETSCVSPSCLDTARTCGAACAQQEKQCAARCFGRFLPNELHEDRVVLRRRLRKHVLCMRPRFGLQRDSGLHWTLPHRTKADYSSASTSGSRSPRTRITGHATARMMRSERERDQRRRSFQCAPRMTKDGL